MVTSPIFLSSRNFLLQESSFVCFIESFHYIAVRKKGKDVATQTPLETSPPTQEGAATAQGVDYTGECASQLSALHLDSTEEKLCWRHFLLSKLYLPSMKGSLPVPGDCNGDLETCKLRKCCSACKSRCLCEH